MPPKRTLRLVDHERACRRVSIAPRRLRRPRACAEVAARDRPRSPPAPPRRLRAPPRPTSSTTARSATASAIAAFCSTSTTVTPRRLISAITSRELLDDPRREAERGLVEQQHARAGHQRAADREHLLLAAGEQAGALGPALAQDREQLVDARPGRRAPACRAPRARRRAGSPRRSGRRRCAAPRGPGRGRRGRCPRGRAPTRLRAGERDRAAVTCRAGRSVPESARSSVRLSRAVVAEHGGTAPSRDLRATRPRSALHRARVADVQVAHAEHGRSIVTGASLSSNSHHSSLLGWPVCRGTVSGHLICRSPAADARPQARRRYSATCLGSARAEAGAEAVDAVDERLEELLAARLVEVGEHRVLHVRDRAVAGREHLAPASTSATSTTRPWLAAGERTIRPSASSAISTSFMDCGVT